MDERIGKKTKGIVKVCAKCGKPMSLWEFKYLPLLWWVCWECPNLIDYQSEEASKLKEVEVT